MHETPDIPTSDTPPVSDAEVEAAAEAIWDMISGRPFRDLNRDQVAIYMSQARAALTAAAKVRQKENDRNPLIERARVHVSGLREYSDGMDPDDFHAILNRHEELLMEITIEQSSLRTRAEAAESQVAGLKKYANDCAKAMVTSPAAQERDALKAEVELWKENAYAAANGKGRVQ